jgi:DNA processing protein
MDFILLFVPPQRGGMEIVVENYIYWLWLSLAGGAANNAYSVLLEHFGDAESIYKAGKDEYSRVEGLRFDLAKKLCNKDLRRAREIYDFCKSHSVRLLHCMEPEYPVKLKWIYAYPVLLYVYGTLPNLNEMLTVGIVGTRRYTDYGRIAAYKIGGGLARAKSVVVSGLALGIDAISQLAAMNNGGKTIAVMGTGIDRIYPSEHRELAKLVSKNGAIVTEFPPGSAPLKHHFPMRNRIISGLSDAVALIECPQRSGAMITTKYATEQSRSVYAVPGDITSPTSYGPISLLKDGAKPITTAADIIEDFVCQYSYLNAVLENTNFDVNVTADSGFVYNEILVSTKSKRLRKSDAVIFNDERPDDGQLYDDTEKAKFVLPEKKAKRKSKEKEIAQKTPETKKEKKAPENLDEIEMKIYSKIEKAGKINADNLVSDEISASQALSALTKLEILGHISALPGGFYEIN